MARGWESKSVEDQIGDAQAEREARSKPQVPLAVREKNAHRQSLLLSRSQILGRLEVTQNAQYRAQLQLALTHVDAQLRECD